MSKRHLRLSFGALCISIMRTVGQMTLFDQRAAGKNNATAPPVRASIIAPKIDESLTAAAEAAGSIEGSDVDYAGVAVNPDKRSLQVYRVGGRDGLSPDLSSALVKILPAGVSLELEVAVLSQSQKQIIDAVVASHIADLGALDVHLQGWGQEDGWDQPYTITYSGNGVPPANLISELTQFGKGTVVFRKDHFVPFADRNAILRHSTAAPRFDPITALRITLRRARTTLARTTSRLKSAG